MTEEELKGWWTNYVRPIVNQALINSIPVVLGKRSGNLNYCKHIYYDIL